MKSFALAVGLSVLAGVAAACPNPDFTPSDTMNLTRDMLVQGVTLGIVAGGSTEVSTCPDAGYGLAWGYFSVAPDYRLNISGLGQNDRLVFRAISSCQTGVLVRASGGNWIFSDFQSFNIDGPWPFAALENATDGQWDLWYGSSNTEYCSGQVLVEIRQ